MALEGIASVDKFAVSIPLIVRFKGRITVEESENSTLHPIL